MRHRQIGAHRHTVVAGQVAGLISPNLPISPHISGQVAGSINALGESADAAVAMSIELPKDARGSIAYLINEPTLATGAARV